jgi:outer membrane protein assembly factor BamB
MRRFAQLAAAVAGSLLISTASLAASFPDTIPLADGWQPEGIAAGSGTTAYVGSLIDGGITRLDLRTGARNDDFVASATGPAVGLEYEAGANRLWVAGGPTGQVRVYDAASGELLRTFTFPAGFINDLVATRDAVYATDSFIQQLLVIPLGDGGNLPDPADTFAVPITGDFQYGAGFNANGIVSFGGWLIVPNSTTGELFAIDPATGNSTRILPAGSIPAADGLELVGSTLYVSQNAIPQISVWRIQGGVVTSLGVLSDDADLDFPATIAFAGGSLWAANARFGTLPGPDVPYWITRIELH